MEGLVMLRMTYGGALAAACICAAPVLALAAFDIDGARPLRRALNGVAAALILLGIVVSLF